MAPQGESSSKEKRLTSITPRKFTRFFTPRSHGPSAAGSSRRILFDVTAPANNRRGVQSSPIRPLNTIADQENSPISFTRDMKRRKLLHTPEPTLSEKNSPCDDPFSSHVGDMTPEYGYFSSFAAEGFERSTCELSTHLDYDDDAPRCTISEEPSIGRYALPIRRAASRGLAGNLLRSRHGSIPSRRHDTSSPISDWQDETASFYSRPADTHFCSSIEGPDRCIPFCVASCNTNSLMAVGDEEGRIRILESAKESQPAFKDIYVSFRPHSNAIIDMCFSQDDSLIATASGDQTSRVIDMATQTTISVLSNHTASLKQVRFQPGAANNSVLATSSRDGSVQIWDLRCKGMEGPVQSIQIPLDPLDNPLQPAPPSRLNYGAAINGIYQAHRSAAPSRSLPPLTSTDGPTRGEIPGRAGDVSITALTFLPAGHEHLLLTASESNATVKLWDIRSLQRPRRPPTAISSTALPRSHSQWRHFGVSSLNISGDGGRLYSLCKDNTVYAYSMAHLILGRAPDLASRNPPRRHALAREQEGLGPLYGFRHKKLHVTSFYVKSALREAREGKAEMLAVGSSDGCTILFPTDERYHRGAGAAPSSAALDIESDDGQPQLPPLRTHSDAPRVADDIPIYTNGTPLVRGHDREVGALTWTRGGELVTVGDDFLVRCWREGEGARDLRMGGEEGGRRWGAGWAEVEGGYDDDEE
ncbi:hypothetical protein VE01_01960 [Pseudogymnoascus verrucosus]|uniref:Uncharacterized protein n=1 Tax=Pseudogymnoascus verrucosus TaxID=342668 RepID=A0A1B8GVY7_9PEZI|nr:uncharacterized protein VE01_01960 [Pseudogymnoascus verrucosus]OBT99960.1 hypothetical protein VE01_01960 [Pseudogymnoascus verrucosus]